MENDDRRVVVAADGDPSFRVGEAVESPGTFEHRYPQLWVVTELIGDGTRAWAFRALQVTRYG